MRLKMGQHGASETPGFGKLLPEVFSTCAFGKGEKAMAQESVNYQCPNCMGPLRYKGDSGMLECEFCESTFTPAQVEEAYAAKQREADEKAEAAVARAEAGQQSSFERMADEAAGASSVVTEDVIDAAVAVGAQAESSIASYLSRASWNEEERAGMRTYLCSSCGAQLTSDATTAIQECPYCGNQAMAPGSFVDTAKPDLVIPFKLDKAAAEQTLTEYYKGKKFLPKEFAAQNRIAHVQGVYVPFWLYDGSASGEGTFEARNIRTWREGKYEVTETHVYNAWRQGSSEFTRIPADGSAKMPDEHMDAIEPFDYDELTPFSVAYLPGFSAERYDQDSDACCHRAVRRMENTLADQLRDTVTGYDQVDPADVDAEVSFSEIKQALLPVWMLHTRWKDKDFLFAMNGQTGRLVGDLPVSPLKVVLWFLGIFLVVGAVMLGVDFGFIQFDDTVTRVGVDAGVPLVVAAGTCIYFYSQMKTAVEQRSAHAYVVNGSFDLTGSDDTFVTSYQTRTLVETDDDDKR